MLEFRHRDGSNQLGDLNPGAGAYSDCTPLYIPVNTPEPDPVKDPDHWQPLRVPDGRGGFVIQSYIAPHWGRVTPFALSTGADLRPTVGPARSGTPEYVQQARDLLDYSANLTDEHKTIVEYWADGPGTEQPPGHWCLFAQSVSRRDHFGVDEDVKLLFGTMNTAMMCGSVCWRAGNVARWVASPIVETYWSRAARVSQRQWTIACLTQ